MDIRKVKKLIELLEESNVNEIEIKEGEESVRISRGAAAPAVASPVAAPVVAQAAAPIAQEAPPTAAPALAPVPPPVVSTRPRSVMVERTSSLPPFLACR